MKFRALRKKLAQYDIAWDESLGKGSHGVFVGLTLRTRIRRVFPLPASQQKDVSQPYLKSLRRKFELTPDDDISDKEFFGV